MSLWCQMKSCSYKKINWVGQLLDDLKTNHIILRLTPADAYTKSGSWIKMNFPTIDIDRHPYRGHSYWTRSAGLTQCLIGPILTDGLSEIFCLYQDLKPTTVILSNMEKPKLLLSFCKIYIYQRALGVSAFSYYPCHSHQNSETENPLLELALR